MTSKKKAPPAADLLDHEASVRRIRLLEAELVAKDLERTAAAVAAKETKLAAQAAEKRAEALDDEQRAISQKIQEAKNEAASQETKALLVALSNITMDKRHWEAVDQACQAIGAQVGPVKVSIEEWDDSQTAQIVVRIAVPSWCV